MFFAALVLSMASVHGYDSDPAKVADGKAVFVDMNNPECSDNIDWTTAKNPAKPFCSVSKAMAVAESGGTIYIRAGTYNSWHTLNGINPSSQITFINYPNEKPVLINSISDFLKAGNSMWQKKTDAATYWVSNPVSDELSTSGTVHLSDGTLFATYSSLTDFKGSRQDAAYFDVQKRQVYIRFKDQTKDPRTLPLYVSRKGPGVVHLNGISGAGIKLKGLTIKFGSIGVHIEDSSKVILDSNKIIGGIVGVWLQGGDGKTLTSCEIKHNEIAGAFNKDWRWMDIKGGRGMDPMETAGIRTREIDAGNKIYSNRIYKWFDGISDHTGKSGKADKLEIYKNTITDIYDDALETENFQTNQKIYDNIMTDVFVGISLAPAKCSGDCQIYNNQIGATKTIAWDGSDILSGECFKVGDEAGPAENWRIHHNSCHADRHAILGNVEKSQKYMKWTDNIFSTKSSLLILRSGLSSSTVFYDNNLYYAPEEGILLKCWNEDSNCQAFSTLSDALKSSLWDGKWDKSSKQANPMWKNPGSDFSLHFGSPACNMSSTGSYVGAIPCSTPTVVCGDDTCNGKENCTTCSKDCGVCAPVCGDGTCNGKENCTTCSKDCGVCAPVCGDGTCNGKENCTTCSKDCGTCPVKVPVCGDGACNGNENCTTCSKDCGVCAPVCGDGSCNGIESCSTCEADCGRCKNRGGSGGGSSGGSSSQTSCTERWECTDWGECIFEIKTRSCLDLNSCGTENKKPSEEMDCIPEVSLIDDAPAEEEVLSPGSSAEPELLHSVPSASIVETPFLPDEISVAKEDEKESGSAFWVLSLLALAGIGAFLYYKPITAANAVIKDPYLDLKHLINLARQNGYDDRYIKDFLSRHGLDDAVVKSLVTEISVVNKEKKHPSMSEWHGYFIENLKLGVSIEEIEKHLVAYGYDEEVVTYLVRDFKVTYGLGG